jgi:hypothetical protein
MISRREFHVAREKEILLLSISLLNLILTDAVVAVVAAKNDISSYTLESFLPTSIVDVDGSLLSMFQLSTEKNRKRSKGKATTKKTSFIAFYQLKFYFVSFFFHELLWNWK